MGQKHHLGFGQPLEQLVKDLHNAFGYAVGVMVGGGSHGVVHHCNLSWRKSGLRLTIRIRELRAELDRQKRLHPTTLGQPLVGASRLVIANIPTDPGQPAEQQFQLARRTGEPGF